MANLKKLIKGWKCNPFWSSPEGIALEKEIRERAEKSAKNLKKVLTGSQRIKRI